MNQSSLRTNAAVVWGVLTGMFAASVWLPVPGRDGRIAHLPSFCPFYILTGLPCPGCGLTRAFVCLGHGQWRESLHWHPLGWLVFLLLAGLWLRNGIYWLRGVALWSGSPAALNRLSWAGIAALLVFGAGRIGWLAMHHLRF